MCLPDSVLLMKCAEYRHVLSVHNQTESWGLWWRMTATCHPSGINRAIPGLLRREPVVGWGGGAPWGCF